MKQQPEYILQRQVCEYLKTAYPKIYFLSDTVAQIKLTFSQQSRNKAIQCSRFKCPDLLILCPANGYHGLFIELKAKTPFKLNGELLKDEHLQGQAETIAELNRLGYMACFGWEFEQVRRIIDEYLLGM